MVGYSKITHFRSELGEEASKLDVMSNLREVGKNKNYQDFRDGRLLWKMAFFGRGLVKTSFSERVKW